MSDGTTAPPSPRSPGVERAVEREMRRQVGLSILFTVLLLVPLALAGYYFVSGRTDREVVRDEVRKGVEPIAQEARQLRPALEEAKGAAADARRQRTLVDEQLQRVGSLLQEQEQVRAQVARLAEQLPRLEASVSQARHFEASVAELRSTLAAQTARLETLAAGQECILRDQDQIRGEILVFERRPVRPPG